jgi:hypothetical protein
MEDRQATHTMGEDDLSARLVGALSIGELLRPTRLWWGLDSLTGSFGQGNLLSWPGVKWSARLFKK